ncbi:hypothetical protein [Marivita sp. S2033]|uniref:hypothetical protein n=1 Tax=Marivita sp. S2033 TaxID=3373187 RepID=UPI003982B495
MASSVSMLRIAGAVAVLFGALTVMSGASTLLGTLDMGAVVPVVLWFNTVAGIAYIVAGYGLWQRRHWAYALSFAIFAATALVFAIFWFEVTRGGAFEMRTVFAMALRSAVWAAITLVARKGLKKSGNPVSR